MTEHSHILSLLKEQSERIKNIEKLLVESEVQRTQISALQVQMSAVWKKLDKLFGPEGVFSEVKSYQASCPKDEIMKSVSRLWWAMGVLATLQVTLIAGLLSAM